MSRPIRNMRTISEIQQDFANSSGFNSEVIWDLLSEEQSSIMKDKIAKLIPDQQKGKTRIEEMRKNLFDSIWAQRKYTNGKSLSAIIYVFVADCENERSALRSTNFSCHPVFRTRKCTSEDNSSSCCMIFIDEQGRVYKNWKAYISDNELPDGMMVAPRNGIYTTDYEGKVHLETCITPNGSIARKALGVADTASAVAGFGAGVMMIVAPPVAVGAAAVCITTAAYSTIRSVFNLVDRKQHGQSISLESSQARSSWIGVGAGVIGLGASGATRAMTKAATAGKDISVMTKLIVNGMNISSIVISGTGVANGVLDLFIRFCDDEELSSLELAQLAASLVLFTHSVANFRLASTLIKETHNTRIQDYRKSLSNRQRKMFDKMSKETIRIRGESRGKIDIIRNVNDMPSKQILNDLYKINKDLNQAKVRPSFATDGGTGILLNNEVKVDPKVLRNNVQSKQGPSVFNTVKQPIPASYSDINSPSPSQLVPLKNTTKNSLPINFSRGAISMGCIILPNKDIIKLCEFGKKMFDLIGNADGFEDIITTLADIFDKKVFHFLMKTAQKFIEDTLDELIAIVKIYIPSESILYRILVFCRKKYTNYTFEYLSQKEKEILEAIKKYFISLNPNAERNSIKCDICSGFYSICRI